MLSRGCLGFCKSQLCKHVCRLSWHRNTSIQMTLQNTCLHSEILQKPQAPRYQNAVICHFKVPFLTDNHNISCKAQFSSSEINIPGCMQCLIFWKSACLIEHQALLFYENWRESCDLGPESPQKTGKFRIQHDYNSQQGVLTPCSQSQLFLWSFIDELNFFNYWVVRSYYKRGQLSLSSKHLAVVIIPLHSWRPPCSH